MTMLCPICGNQKFKKKRFMHEVAKWINKKYPLFKCMNCALIRHFPPPYKDFSKLSIYDSEKKAILFNSSEYKDYFRHFKLFIKFIEKYNIKGKALDVGCGAGHIIELMLKKGLDAEGLEISKKLADSLKEKFKVYCCEIDDKKLKKNSYTLVTMSQVLEHTENPDKFIKEASRLLIKNGLIILSVPYLKGIIPRILRTKWYGLGHGQHLNFFSKKNLRILFKKNGFEICEFKIKSLDYTHPKFPLLINLISEIISKTIGFLGLGDNLYVVARKIKNTKRK